MRAKRFHGLFIIIFLCVPSLYASRGVFEGYYVGIAGGMPVSIAETRSKSSAQFDPLTTAQVLTAESAHDVSKFHPWGEISCGYGWRWCACYLGARLGVNFSRFSPNARVKANYTETDAAGASLQSAQLEDTIKTRMWTTEYTFDLKPGLVICERTMLFGLLGLAVNKEYLEGSSSFNFVRVVGQVSSQDEITFQRDCLATRFHVGLGIEQMLYRCLSLQISYVYTQYGRLQRSATKIFQEEPTLDRVFHSATFSTKVRRQVASIGLNYYF